MTEVLAPLFPANANESATAMRTLLVLQKRGRPFLFLPQETTCAIGALNLYPAQKLLARSARALLRMALCVRLNIFFKKALINISLEQPFACFLVSLTGETVLPHFAVLAGNPNAQGRRFILLVFDTSNQPCAVVKVGYGKDAVRLIQKEEQFLSSANLAGVPQLRTSFKTDSVQGFALDFLEGNSPDETNVGKMGELLYAWIDFNRVVGVSDVPAWKQLDEKCPDVPLFKSLREKLESARFHPVIHHGDFAPWNIKVSPEDGAWVALDWERGELVGFPNWDWFHYKIQPWILVSRISFNHLAEKVEDLLCSEALLRYAEATKTTNFLRELLLAYLLHAAEIIQPTEGLQTTRDLLNVLAKKWQFV